MKSFRKAIAIGILLGAAPATLFAQTPLGTEWTYQGQLRLSGSPVSDTADFRVTLWDDPVAGTQIGTAVTVLGVGVVDGLFTLNLDFGAAAFDTDARWMQIAVRSPAGAGTYTTLGLRQPLTAVPFALKVRGLDGHSLDAADGNPADAVYVDNAGRVGIGTTTPVDKLTISQGSLRVDRGAQTANQQGILTLNGARTGGNNPFASIDFSNFDSDSSAIDYSGARILSFNADGDADSGDLRFYTKGTADGNPLSRLRITPAGDVGVNSNAPAAKLEVRRATGDTEVARFADQNGASQLRIQATSARGEIQGWNGTADLPGNLALNKDGGNVGIGTSAPNAVVHIKHSGDFYTPVRFETAGISGPALSLKHTGTGGKEWLALSQGSFNGTAGNFSIRNESDGFDPITIKPSGFVGIGTSNPKKMLHNTGDYYGKGHVWLHAFEGDGTSGTAYVQARDDSGTSSIAMQLRTQNAGNVVTAMTLTSTGSVQVNEIQIFGADVAERFLSKDEITPGMVVMIDRDNPGKLSLAEGEYNKCVAGIASGANGLPAGTILGNLPGHEEAAPIALAGRVWCWCDTTGSGPIEPGDFLTTSSIPGHAMKASDATRSAGAIVGKAMTPLADGKGMVLVLMSLQ